MANSQRLLVRAALICFLAFAWASITSAQTASDKDPTTRSRQDSAARSTHSSPAGATTDISTLLRKGWVQFVRFEVPAGTQVEIASSSGVISLPTPAQLGLAVGRPYRLRLSNIPGTNGLALYPTVQLVGYIMPPAQVDPLDYPIPLHFLARDIEEASQGRLVRNVIYLEDPAVALPIAFPRGELPVIDLAPGEDVLQVASSMGRPIAFIQVGNRVPLDTQFEDATDAAPVFFGPSSAQTSSADERRIVQSVNWETGSSCRGCGTDAVRPSRPACAAAEPVIRLPYKTHPRMPRDEYLCDGAHQVPYAHFSGHGTVAGLGPSETIAQFSRPGENPRLVSSNQVCLYAPRFGLMRSSFGSFGSTQIQGHRNMEQAIRRGAVQGRASVGSRTQKNQPRAVRQRERPTSVATTDLVDALDELRVLNAVHQQEGFEHLAGSIGPDNVGQGQEPRIAMSIEAAVVWNRAQYPAYTAITESGAQISGQIETGEVQQIREAVRKPGELVLWKTASTQAARQGEVVEFAIHYRNMGDRPVDSVSIIDSLTARLEYVANSAQTDRQAVFSATPNDAESHELRWDILASIPGGQAGVVWFKAKVR